MKLFIKNMVCPRCIMAVEQILSDNSIGFNYVHLGEVESQKKLSDQEIKNLSGQLEKMGFELLDDSKTKLINQIKTLLIQKVQEENIELHFSLHKFLTQNIFRDYSSISKLFSETEGITIEQFFILQKIEKIKERLIYNEQSLGEMALNLGYSSTQHLSGQFKKLTGMTPTQFKSRGALNRKPIDSIQ